MNKYTDYSTSLNTFVAQEITSGAYCLDVGCSTGNLGASLIAVKSCKFDGVDFDSASLRQAQKRGYKRTWVVDLNNNLTLKDVKPRTYDFVIFADVLEHTTYPEEVLSFFAKYLKKGGHVIISVPNVAFIQNRLNLLFGNWNYTDYGTLDKTHLKFFTVPTLISLVKNTGLTVVSCKPYYQFGLRKFIQPLVNIVPRLFGYQILLVAQKQ